MKRQSTFAKSISVEAERVAVVKQLHASRRASDIDITGSASGMKLYFLLAEAITATERKISMELRSHPPKRGICHRLGEETHIPMSPAVCIGAKQIRVSSRSMNATG